MRGGLGRGVDGCWGCRLVWEERTWFCCICGGPTSLLLYNGLAYDEGVVVGDEDIENGRGKRLGKRADGNGDIAWLWSGWRYWCFDSYV